MADWERWIRRAPDVTLPASTTAPHETAATALFVAESLIVIAPVVVPGIVLAAWIGASRANDRIVTIFRGQVVTTVIVASTIGAVTPVCAVTVSPAMTALLAACVPLSPMMAFWLSSPVTDPSMFAATVATLGLPFAIGKTTAAFGLGVFGGLMMSGFSKAGSIAAPLCHNRLAGSLGVRRDWESGTFSAAIWRDPSRRARFLRETWTISLDSC